MVTTKALLLKHCYRRQGNDFEEDGRQNGTLSI